MSDVEDLANELVDAWLETYAEKGAQAFSENEARRADIIRRAQIAGVYEAVYARANSIMHGN
jgi:hypothetical protein